MTDGDEGAKTGGGPEHVTPGEILPSEVSPSDSTPREPLTVASPPTSTPKSEWTASDARGPLVAADEEFSDDAPYEGDGQDVPASNHVSASDHVAASDHVSRTDNATDAPAAKPAEQPPSRRSAWPIAAGLIVGAAVGAIIAVVAFQLEGGAAGSNPQVAALADKVAALQAKADKAGSLTSSVADLETKVASLQKTVANLPKPSATTAPQAAFDPAPLEQKFSALAASVEALKTQAAGAQDVQTKVGDLAATVTALQKQATSNDSSLQAMQGQQKSLETKVGAPALAVVVDSLVQQIDAGRPYATQLDALASLGADPAKLAVLKPNATTGVPSAKALAAGFVPLAEPILAIEHRAPPNAGFMERMKTGMMSLVSVRRADDVSGTDLSSRVGRIQADLAHDDVGDAAATWAALPADAKAKSEAWGAQVKISADAVTAARAMQSDAIAAMGGRKS